MKYRPEIDGLRAIAVLGVIFYHLGMGFSGGYVGVDVFFVISGYLITSIIIRELDEGKFTFSNFWIRRIKRIFPASAVVVLFVLITGFLFLDASTFKSTGASIFSWSFLAANLNFYLRSGYFDITSEDKPLLHMWSLAVEEQFYILFPFILFVIYKYWKPYLFHCVAVIITTSFILNIAMIGHDINFTFYLLPTRAWELGAGAIIAISLPFKKASRRSKEFFSIAGLIIIFCSMIFLNSAINFPGYWALLPVLGTLLFIVSTTDQQTWSGNLLSSKLIIYLGKISYSLYLWHWVFISYFYILGFEKTLSIQITILVLTFIFSIPSYHFIEQFFRKRNEPKKPTIIFLSYFSTSLAIAASGLFIYMSNGLVSRFDRIEKDKTLDISWVGKEYITKENNPLVFGEDCQSDSDSIDFIVWGNSHGLVLGDTLETMSCKYKVSGQAFLIPEQHPITNIKYRGSELSEKESYEVSQKTFNGIINSEAQHVLLISRWSTLLANNVYLINEEYQHGTPIENNPDYSSAFVSNNSLDQKLQQLTGMIQSLEDHGKTVWILQQVPHLGDDNAARRFYYSTKYPSLVPRPVYEVTRNSHEEREKKLNDHFKSIASENIKLLDASEYFFQENGNIFNGTERSYYKDSNHLTKYGAEQTIAPTLAPFFEAVKQEK